MSITFIASIPKVIIIIEGMADNNERSRLIWCWLIRQHSFPLWLVYCLSRKIWFGELLVMSIILHRHAATALPTDAGSPVCHHWQWPKFIYICHHAAVYFHWCWLRFPTTQIHIIVNFRSGWRHALHHGSHYRHYSPRFWIIVAGHRHHACQHADLSCVEGRWYIYSASSLTFDRLIWDVLANAISPMEYPPITLKRC